MRRSLVIGALALTPALVSAQGPLLSYLADPGTALSWASCEVYLPGGSSHRIPVLPVVTTRERAPLGTDRYTRDIRVDGVIVFAGDGIVGNDVDAYRGLDVAGKVVMLAYDLSADSALEERIREAARRKAAAVILVSTREAYPFPTFGSRAGEPIPSLPAIAVNRQTADLIFAAAGLDAGKLFEKWKAESTIAPQVLIVRVRLHIDGAFDVVERPGFRFLFEKGIARARIDETVDGNVKSVAFVTDLFKAASLTWRPSIVTYFKGYDSKLFYTHHWGKGLSSEAGSFMVFEPSDRTFALAVHENTHTLISDNWGGSSSFLNEGLARYAESAATEPDRDHRETLAFIRDAKLPPLAEMTGMNVGRDPRTDMGYPAAGSFVSYLVATYGLSRVKTLYGRPDAWTDAFGKALPDLDRDWREWLRRR